MRLLVTVGAQMPFDRLVSAVDAWAAQHPEHAIRAQVGRTDARFAHLDVCPFLPPAEFDRAYDEADAVIGHAGIGTLFAALERGKPILVLPREAARRETRNNHQLATARRFADSPGVVVAWSEQDLPAAMERLLALEGEASLDPVASGPLIDAIARFIDRS